MTRQALHCTSVAFIISVSSEGNLLVPGKLVPASPASNPGLRFLLFLVLPQPLFFFQPKKSSSKFERAVYTAFHLVLPNIMANKAVKVAKLISGLLDRHTLAM